MMELIYYRITLKPKKMLWKNFKLLTDAIIRDKPFIELKKKEVTNG